MEFAVENALYDIESLLFANYGDKYNSYRFFISAFICANRIITGNNVHVSAGIKAITPNNCFLKTRYSNAVVAPGNDYTRALDMHSGAALASKLFA